MLSVDTKHEYTILRYSICTSTQWQVASRKRVCTRSARGPQAAEKSQRTPSLAIFYLILKCFLLFHTRHNICPSGLFLLCSFYRTSTLSICVCVFFILYFTRYLCPSRSSTPVSVPVPSPRDIPALCGNKTRKPGGTSCSSQIRTLANAMPKRILDAKSRPHRAIHKPGKKMYLW